MCLKVRDLKLHNRALPLTFATHPHVLQLLLHLFWLSLVCTHDPTITENGSTNQEYHTMDGIRERLSGQIVA